MSRYSQEDIFQITSIVGSSLNNANNTISLTTGDATIGEVVGPTVQLWQQSGLASIPALAEPGQGSAESINLIRTNGDISIATRDLRTQNIYGNLGPGETCLYATGPVASAGAQGQARVLLKGDGSVSLMTTADTLGAPVNMPTGNTEAGPSVMLRIDPNALTFTAPWGSLIFDQTGFHIQTVTGASFDLTNVGSVPGLPPGIVPINSCQITSSSVSINAPTVNLGPDQTNGGIMYAPAVFGIVPPVAPLVPILGVGVGAVTVAASSSTKVFISI